MTTRRERRRRRRWEKKKVAKARWKKAKIKINSILKTIQISEIYYLNIMLACEAPNGKVNQSLLLFLLIFPRVFIYVENVSRLKICASMIFAYLNCKARISILACCWNDIDRQNCLKRIALALMLLCILITGILKSSNIPN